MKKIFYFLLTLNLAFAALEDYRIATWNLQGSSSATESKWNVSIRQLISGENPANILLVQEAGQIPSTARPTRRMIQPGGTPIEEYVWELGTTSRPKVVFIYFANIDVGADRVNLAIVSDRRADEVFVVRQTTIAAQTSRPAIGIRIDNDVFFTIHALARGGGDAGALVTAVHDEMSRHPNLSWILAGDFNRSPAELRAGLDTRITNDIRILAPTSATHFSQSRGEHRVLDYAVVGRTDRAVASRQPVFPNLSVIPMTPNVVSHLVSDHRPIQFRSF